MEKTSQDNENVGNVSEKVLIDCEAGQVVLKTRTKKQLNLLEYASVGLSIIYPFMEERPSSFQVPISGNPG